MRFAVALALPLALVACPAPPAVDDPTRDVVDDVDDVLDPFDPELCGGDADVDGDGAAGCGDSDCAADWHCAIGSASCVQPDAVPTLDGMRARFADEIAPLFTREQQGCTRCHAAGASPRAFLVDEADASATFDLVVAGQWLDLDDDFAVPARVFADEMPKASPPWSDTEKNVLRSFACDLSFVEDAVPEVPVELGCTDGDDDADGLADCADPDCAGALECLEVPNGCPVPTAVPTREDIASRYLTDIDPMLRANPGGCVQCHRGTGFRDMRIENDPQLTFDVLFSGGWFDLANEDGIPEKVFTDEMPKNSAPWTAEQKATLHAFACDAALVPTGPVVEPPQHEHDCANGDDDGDGLADCADPDCGSQFICQPSPDITCAAPATAPTLASLQARFTADIDPLLRGDAKGCMPCHRGDGMRAMRLQGDATATFTSLHEQGWLSLDNANGILARVVSGNMPKMRDEWSDGEKALLTSFACDLSVVTGEVPGEGEGEGELPTGDEAGAVDDPLTIALPFDGSVDIAAGGEADCFAFTLAQPSRVVVDIDDAANGDDTCQAGFDTFTTIYERTFAFAAADDDAATGDLCGNLDVELGVGSYTVCVEEYGLAAALDGVSLSFAATALDIDDDAPNLVGADGVAPATLPLDRDLNVAPTLDSDCFAFTAPVGRSFYWTGSSAPSSGASACPADTLLEMFAVVGDDELRIANDDSGEGSCSLLVVDADEALPVTLCASTRTAPSVVNGVSLRGRAGRDGLMIAAVDYDTPGTDADEAVVITNTGAVAASLGGVFLASVNGSNGSLVKTMDLSAAGSLAPGASLVVAQNPASFGGPGDLVIPAGTTSFLQNGGTTGDGVMLVSTVGGGSVIDSIAWDGACAVSGKQIGNAVFTHNLVEGTPAQLLDDDVAGGALCRRALDDVANEPFAGAMDTNDAALDLVRCTF